MLIIGINFFGLIEIDLICFIIILLILIGVWVFNELMFLNLVFSWYVLLLLLMLVFVILNVSNVKVVIFRVIKKLIKIFNFCEFIFIF